MKLKHILLPLIAFAAYYLSACQKDFTVDNTIVARVDSTITPSAEDSSYLDKIIMRDTAVVSGNTVIDSSAWIFNYDVQKRLSLVTAKSISNPNDSTNLFKFYYNQNDSLPFKVVNISSLAFTETYYLYYNSLGKLIKDSVNNFLGNGENLSRTLSYSGNKIFAQLYSTTATLNPIEKDTFTQDLNMNITNFKYYVKTSASSFELARMSNIIFDNGKSPYFKVPSMKIFWFTFFTIDFEASSNACPGVNNIVTGIYNRYPYTGSGTINHPTDTFSVLNTYYQNGLLKNTISNDHENWTYIYKSL